MGDAKENINSMVAKVRPSMPMFKCRPVLSMRMVFRPGVALCFKKEQIRELPEGQGFEMQVDSEDGSPPAWQKLDVNEVWCVEDKGPPPPDYWSWGIFMSIEMQDNVSGPRGETKLLQAHTSQLIATVPLALVADLERQMKFGSGIILGH